MSRTTWRRTARLVGMAAALAAGTALSVATASAGGRPRERLVASGWTCFHPPASTAWSCFNPGLGRPFPGNPDPRPTYAFLTFDASDTFTGYGDLIRADLYQGLTRANGQPYVLRALIGYDQRGGTDPRDGPSRRVRCAASRRPWPPAAVAARTLVLMEDPPVPARAAFDRILVEPRPRTCGSSRRRSS